MRRVQALDVEGDAGGRHAVVVADVNATVGAACASESDRCNSPCRSVKSDATTVPTLPTADKLA